MDGECPNRFMPLAALGIDGGVLSNEAAEEWWEVDELSR